MKSTVLIAGFIVFGSIIILIGLYVGLGIWGDWHDNWSGYTSQNYVSDGVCNIGVFSVDGVIAPYHETDEYMTTTPEDVQQFFKNAENDPYIRGVLVQIDSLGGTPAASKSIADLLKSSPMTTVAYTGDYATSGGYLIATGADSIVSSPFSDIGGIGVTMSYVSNTKQNEMEGLEYVKLSSAIYKDYGSPDKELTPDEEKLIERDLAIYHTEFVNEVATNRNLPTEAVALLADGSSMPASLALQNKLVDVVGGTNEVKTTFAEKLGIPVEEVIFCE